MKFNGLRHSPEGRRPGGAGVALLGAGEREKKMPGPHGTEDTIDRVRTHHRVKLSDVQEDALVVEGTDVPVRYLLNHVDRMYNLFALLEDHPQVSPEQALAGIREHVKAEIPAHCNVASRPPHTERGSCHIEVPRFERPSQTSPRRNTGHFPGHRLILAALPDP